ncbi:MAG TPA: hypothetical protein VGI58_15315 [Streptosporangiaceae bacterium]
MHLTSVLPRSVQTAGRPVTGRIRRWVRWLIPVCYLLIAFLLTWRVWAAPTLRAPTPGSTKVLPDVYLNVWFMHYAANAVAHGHLPALVTTALNWPQGVNAMWNTSLLLPSVVLAPVTLIWGPVASLAVLLTAGLAGSALAMYVILRRWGASYPAAIAGGAVYGFSPALMAAAGDHYHLEFAVLPPLIADAVLRLVTGRAGPGLRRILRTGGWLGLLVAAQVFIAEEMLVDTVLVIAVLLIFLAASRPRAILVGLRQAAAGLGVTAAVVLLLTGPALWVQFHGPLAETGSPWRISQYGNRLQDFVTASQSVLTHGTLRQFVSFLNISHQRLVEYYAYLGWPLLILLLSVIIVCWRDLRIRTAGLSWALLELFSVGGHTVRLHGLRIPAAVLPWHYLWHLPVLGQVLPNRLAILADGAAAAVLAFAADRAWRWTLARPAEQRLVLRCALVAAAAIAILPALPKPVTAGLVSEPPAGWRDVIAGLRLRPDASLLVLPVYGPSTMVWQAEANEQVSVVGGYCIAPGTGRRAAECDTHRTLSRTQQGVLIRLNLLGQGLPASFGPSSRAFGEALMRWRPAAIITTRGGESPVGRYLTSWLGRPTMEHDQVLGWRVPGNRWLMAHLEQARGPDA